MALVRRIPSALLAIFFVATPRLHAEPVAQSYRAVLEIYRAGDTDGAVAAVAHFNAEDIKREFKALANEEARAKPAGLPRMWLRTAAMVHLECALQAERAGLLWCAIAAALLGAPLDGQQRFTSSAEGVRVDVLVTDGSRRVRSLTADDFEVRDNGVVQRVTELDVEHLLPLNVICVFDASSSVAGTRLRELVAAGRALIDDAVDSRYGRAPATLLSMPADQHGKFLDVVTAETGGRVIHIEADKDLAATFTSILGEFRDRYVLSYSPQGVDIPGWHELSVRVKGKSGKVTARRGYFAG